MVSFTFFSRLRLPPKRFRLRALLVACLACSWRIDLIASAEEWNCTSTEGNFTRTNDCMSTEIEVSGDLTIVGANGESSGALTTLYAADSYSRHFTLDGQFTLHIKWLRLTGGNVSKVTTVVKDKEGGPPIVGEYLATSSCNLRTRYNPVAAGRAITMMTGGWTPGQRGQYRGRGCGCGCGQLRSRGLLGMGDSVNSAVVDSLIVVFVCT